MATVEECELAFDRLAKRLSEVDASARRSGFDRSLCCTLNDLDVSYAGRINDGLLVEVRRAQDRHAKVKLELTSDDLLALVDGTLKLAPAWASGRIKVQAGVLDMVKLRSIF